MSGQLCVIVVTVGRVERLVGFGLVAGLVVSQLTTALFDDLVNRQASFEVVGWMNWFLYLLVPTVAGGVLLHYGRTLPTDARRSPERALLASLVALAVATVALRLAVPAILHAGDLIPSRVPRTLADGFSFVASYSRVAPLAGNGGRYDVAATVLCSMLVCAAAAFGALAFDPRNRLPVLVSALAGAAWAGIGWYVPGGAGVRIIGTLWPVFVFGSLGAVLALTARAEPPSSP